MDNEHSEAQTEERIDAELEQLKHDVEQLRTDLGTMLDSAGTYSREKLWEMRMRLRNAMDTLEGRASQKMHAAYDTVHNRGHEMLEKGKGIIEEKPLHSVAWAFAAGIAIALIFGRKE